MNSGFSTHVSAPGRIVLFGDHAINFGGGGVGLAVEHRVHCMAKINSRFSVDEQDLDPIKHPYTRGAVLQGWTDMDKPLAIVTDSKLPQGIGLGEETAKTVACLGAISMLHDHLIFEEIAKNAFEVHYDIDGAGTPLDISTATHGKGIYLSCRTVKNSLWEFQKQDKQWIVHDLKMPEMNLVLGYTGIPAPEKEMASKIQRFYQNNTFARDMMNDMFKTVTEGYEAICAGNLEEIGRLMTNSHKILVTLGAGHPMLDKLIQAAARYSYGAKLTGSGGGGSMIALTHDPEQTITAIESAGGKAYLLKLASEGLRLED